MRCPPALQVAKDIQHLLLLKDVGAFLVSGRVRHLGLQHGMLPDDCVLRHSHHPLDLIEESMPFSAELPLWLLAAFTERAGFLNDVHHVGEGILLQRLLQLLVSHSQPPS